MKRGFTLIELLAVIVILAIIALIATPIVLDIIEDSKKSSSIRSAEYYLDALEQAVAAAQLDNKVITSGIYTVMSDGNICLVIPTDNTCSEEDTLEVQLDGERPSSGSITITSEGKVTVSGLNIGGKYYATNSDGNIEEVEQTEEKIICQAVTEATTGNIPTGEFLPGDEYICEVKEGTSYTFFVLSTDEDNVNLILERNITSDGNLTTEDTVEYTAWLSPEKYSTLEGASTDSIILNNGDNRFGPITVIEFLNEATSTWSNLDNIEINYTDEGSTDSYGYGQIITEDSITKITKLDGTVTATYSNLKARLPYESEVSNFDTENKTNLWMYNYLGANPDIVNGDGLVNTSEMGYWLMSSDPEYASGGGEMFGASCLYYFGSVSSTGAFFSNSHGVRPVISVSKSQIK